jgi:DNA topoisomerase-3
MADQIVITEKTSQAKDVRAVVSSRYGDILPAEGHLLDLLEPEDVVPAWKRWAPILRRRRDPPEFLESCHAPQSQFSI